MTERGRSLLYWIPTAVIALNWSVGGLSSLLHARSSMAVFHELGYPDYFATLLGAAQLLGVLAILAPVPRTLREWAYAGLVFDAGAGALSTLAVGAPAWHAGIPLIALALVLTSHHQWQARDRIDGLPA